MAPKLQYLKDEVPLTLNICDLLTLLVTTANRLKMHEMAVLGGLDLKHLGGNMPPQTPPPPPPAYEYIITNLPECACKVL